MTRVGDRGRRAGVFRHARETIHSNHYEVAAGVEAFADRVRAAYLFALEGLSEDERAAVEEAIDGGYFDDDEAFRSVVDRIRDREGIRVDDFYGTWLLEYEGTEYLTCAEW